MGGQRLQGVPPPAVDHGLEARHGIPLINRPHQREQQGRGVALAEPVDPGVARLGSPGGDLPVGPLAHPASDVHQAVLRLDPDAELTRQLGDRRRGGLLAEREIAEDRLVRDEGLRVPRTSKMRVISRR
jgi:hypothetical protein